MRTTPGSVSTGLWHSGHVGEIVRAGLGVSWWTGVSGADPEQRTPTPRQRRQSTIVSTAPPLPASSGSKGVMTPLQKTNVINFDEKGVEDKPLGSRCSPEFVLGLDMYYVIVCQSNSLPFIEECFRAPHK